MAVEPDEQDGEDLVRKCEDERYERQQAVYVAEDVIPIQDGTDGRRGGDRHRDAGQHCEEARKFGDADERPYGRSVGLDLSVRELAANETLGIEAEKCVRRDSYSKANRGQPIRTRKKHTQC